MLLAKTICVSLLRCKLIWVNPTVAMPTLLKARLGVGLSLLRSLVTGPEQAHCYLLKPIAQPEVLRLNLKTLDFGMPKMRFFLSRKAPFGKDLPPSRDYTRVLRLQQHHRRRHQAIRHPDGSLVSPLQLIQAHHLELGTFPRRDRSLSQLSAIPSSSLIITAPFLNAAVP